MRRAARPCTRSEVRRGDFVGILMGNNEAWVTLFYAAATIGAVTVPINTRFKAAELAFCLAQADVKVLFTADRFLNIDFLSFLRAAEPAIDQALPGERPAAAATRRRGWKRDSASGDRLRLHSWRSRAPCRMTRSMASPRTCGRATCC